jgi:prepilin-type N-terminal cleavage/methylation domain-containing protein
MVTVSRFTISRRYRMLMFVFPARTSSRHAAVPTPRDEGALMLLSSDPPKDGFAVANRRPEFIRRGGTSEKRNSRSSFSTSYFLISTSQRERLSAFTLLELLVVMAIIAILMVLIVPAFTTIKAGNDVTAAAYTIKGVLETARTYAKANNTYVWVGFYEENVSNPSPNSATPAIGRVVMSIISY